MRYVYTFTILLSVSGCTSVFSASTNDCPFLIWMAGPEAKILPQLENVNAASIFGVFSGVVQSGTKVRLEGRLARFQNRLFLVPAGSDTYAETFADRVLIGFSGNTQISNEELDQAGVVMVVGELDSKNKQWVIENPLFIRSLHAASEECVNEG